MDADCQESRRDSYLSQREKRWSMNSQRLEEIVAELMKPISDVRRSFDTDLSALLEEYLTEAGLHALEASEDTEGAAPNFTELALLLQHSASVYGRKVDFLYQHVLTVSDSLQASTAEVAGAGPEEPATPSGKRKRRASGGEGAADVGDFAPLTLTASAAARREPGVTRPPPTLPRIYVELEPRQMTECDAPLLDYEREPIGLLADFQVTWRLQDGLLVDELEGAGVSSGAALRPIPLLELQAALDAAAPPDPPPPVHCSTPLPLASRDGTPAPPDTPTNMLLSRKKERKRKCDSNYELIRSVKILVSKELRRKLSKMCEFSVAEEWITCVVDARKRRVLAARRARAHSGHAGFRGFECTDSVDIGGFPGWSSAECSAARAALRLDDSDDDGFFEQSSLGESDGSRADDSQLAAHASALSHTSCESTEAASSAAWAEWQRGVVERAAAGEARGLDVRQLADRVLHQLPDDGECARPFRDVLRGAHADQADVSGLFLATLFLANAGNVRLVGGRPLRADSFAVQLVSRDRRRLLAAVDVHDRDEGAPPR